MKCKYETTDWYEGMKRCLGTKEVDPCPGYEKCQHFKPYRMTNADHIRSLSDEELADWIVTTGTICACCSLESCCEDDMGYVACKNGVTDWLKQPYGGAEE
jgi:hypothetical protein